jgi:hypothetical protein
MIICSSRPLKRSTWLLHWDDMELLNTSSSIIVYCHQSWKSTHKLWTAKIQNDRLFLQQRIWYYNCVYVSRILESKWKYYTALRLWPKFPTRIQFLQTDQRRLFPSDVCTTCGNYSARYPNEVKLSTQKTSANPFPTQVFLLQLDEINRGTPRLWSMSEAIISDATKLWTTYLLTTQLLNFLPQELLFCKKLLTLDCLQVMMVCNRMNFYFTNEGHKLFPFPYKTLCAKKWVVQVTVPPDECAWTHFTNELICFNKVEAHSYSSLMAFNKLGQLIIVHAPLCQ